MKATLLILLQFIIYTNLCSLDDINWDVEKDTPVTIATDITIIKLQNSNPGDTININDTTIIIINDKITKISILKKNNNWYIEYDSLYPFEFVTTTVAFEYLVKGKNNKNPTKLTLHLKIGEEVKVSSTLNNSNKLFPGLDCRYGPIKNSVTDYCKYMDSSGCDQFIILDASPYFSSKSGVYSKNKAGECKKCCCCGVKVCNNVKVFILNLNPYLYNVSVKSAHFDIGPQI